MTITAYDSIDPSAIPLNAQGVFWYLDGAISQWPPGAIDRFSTPFKLSITTQINPMADICDCEVGNATPAMAAGWAHARVALNRVARIYCNKTVWPEVKQLCTDIQVLWFIADPTGVAHILEGSDATQYAWASLGQTSIRNVDISLCTDHFFNISKSVGDSSHMGLISRDVTGNAFDEIYVSSDGHAHWGAYAGGGGAWDVATFDTDLGSPSNASDLISLTGCFTTYAGILRLNLKGVTKSGQRFLKIMDANNFSTLQDWTLSENTIREYVGPTVTVTSHTHTFNGQTNSSS